MAVGVIWIRTCPSEGAPSTPPGFQLLRSGPPAGIILHPHPASALASWGRLLPTQAVVPMCAQAESCSPSELWAHHLFEGASQAVARRVVPNLGRRPQVALGGQWSLHALPARLCCPH